MPSSQGSRVPASLYPPLLSSSAPHSLLLHIPSHIPPPLQASPFCSLRLAQGRDSQKGMEEPLINELLLVGAALGSTETYTTEDGW